MPDLADCGFSSTISGLHYDGTRAIEFREGETLEHAQIEIFAHLKQAAAASKLMVERRLDPCVSEVFGWSNIPLAHSMILCNEHKPGNMAVLVQSPRTELCTFEDVLLGEIH